METVNKSFFSNSASTFDTYCELNRVTFTRTTQYRRERLVYPEDIAEQDCYGQDPVVEYQEETIVETFESYRGIGSGYSFNTSLDGSFAACSKEFPRPAIPLYPSWYPPVHGWTLYGSGEGTVTRTWAYGSAACVWDEGTQQWVFKLNEQSGGPTVQGNVDDVYVLLYRKWMHQSWVMMFSHERLPEEERTWGLYKVVPGLDNTFTLNPPAPPSGWPTDWAWVNYTETIRIQIGTS